MRDEDYFDDDSIRHEATAPYWTVRRESPMAQVLYMRFDVWPPGARDEYGEELEIGSYDGEVEQLWPTWFGGEKLPARIATWFATMGALHLYEDGTIRWDPEMSPTRHFYVPMDQRCILQRIKKESGYRNWCWTSVHLEGHPFIFAKHMEALAAARVHNASQSDPEMLVYVVPRVIAKSREGQQIVGDIDRQKDPEIPGFARSCRLCKHDIVVLPDGTLTRHDTDGLTPVDPESDGPVARVCAGL